VRFAAVRRSAEGSNALQNERIKARAPRTCPAQLNSHRVCELSADSLLKRSRLSLHLTAAEKYGTRPLVESHFREALTAIVESHFREALTAINEPCSIAVESSVSLKSES